MPSTALALVANLGPTPVDVDDDGTVFAPKITTVDATEVPVGVTHATQTSVESLSAQSPVHPRRWRDARREARERLPHVSKTPVEPLTPTPVPERTADVLMSPSGRPWNDETLVLPNLVLPRNAAVGVGWGRAERLSVILGRLQWTLDSKGLPPLDIGVVRCVRHLAIRHGRRVWDAALRAIHKLNKAVHLPPRGDPIRQASRWLMSTISGRDLWEEIEDALRVEDQRNVKQTNNQYIWHKTNRNNDAHKHERS